MRNKCFFVVDFETGGLSPELHDPVQVAVLVLSPGRLESMGSFVTYIKPDPSRVSEDALKINNLSLEMLSDAPSPEEALRGLIDFLSPYGQGFFVAHNAKFDYDFFRAWVKKSAPEGFNLSSVFDYRTICTAQMSLQKLVLQEGTLDSIKLESITKHFGIKHKAHDALSDVIACAEVFRICMRTPFIKRLFRGIRKSVKQKDLSLIRESISSRV